LDDPTFTNPALYKEISARTKLPDAYADQLIEEGVWTREQLSKTLYEHTASLDDNFKAIESYKPSKENES